MSEHTPESSQSDAPRQMPPKDQPKHPKDPCGGGEQNPKPPEKDPCDDPKPPDDKPPKDPCPPEERPCPPKEDPCPPGRPCPEPPGRPCPPPDPCPPEPDPCDDEPTTPPKDSNGEKPDDGGKPDDCGKPDDDGGGKPDDDGSSYDDGKPDDGRRDDNTGQDYGTPRQNNSSRQSAPTGSTRRSSTTTGQDTSSAAGSTAIAGPADHLSELKRKLEEQLAQLQELEPLKTSTADLTQRIAALEKAMEAQPAASSAYKEFYRATEVLRSEIQCFIPTVRCQLDQIKDKHRKCICEAIAAVDARVRKANRDSARANRIARDLEAKWKHATLTLEWATKWYTFLKTGLQKHVTDLATDLKALKALADPKKDQCEVWFFLYELEAALESKRTKDDTTGAVCWKPDLNVATFLDCWRWECYEQAWNWIVVVFNTAEADEKLLKSQLDQARKRATELEKAAKDAQSKRREWILKEIKARECCGPTSRCP
jgi:hypothetical protein